MNWEPTAAVGQLLAALGVIATLIYLAIQIRQNTKGMRTAVHQHVVTANAAVTMTPAQNLEFASLPRRGAVNSRNLTDDTHLAFNLWCFQYFSMIQASHQLYLDGAIDTGIWDRELQRAVGALRGARVQGGGGKPAAEAN